MNARIGHARVLAIAVWLACVWLQGCDGIGRELVDRTPMDSDPPDGGCATPTLESCKAPNDELQLRPEVPSGATAVTDGRVLALPESSAPLLQGAWLSDANLAIESPLPIEVTIEDSTLEQTFVDLKGPVTLRIVAPRAFHDVRIRGLADANGAPRVELERVSGDGLAVGEPERALQGTLAISRSQLHDLRLSADAIEFDSARIDDMALSSHELLATDLDLTLARVDVGHGVLSASYLTNVRVDACDSLLLVTTAVYSSELPACRGAALRAYDSSLADTSVDGSIESDGSTWHRVTFGRSTQTDVLGWGTTIEMSTFCDRSRFARFGDQQNTVRCSTCTQDAGLEPACAFPAGLVALSHNTGDALQVQQIDGDRLARTNECEGIAPVRPRPRQ